MDLRKDQTEIPGTKNVVIEMKKKKSLNGRVEIVKERIDEIDDRAKLMCQHRAGI